MDEKSNEIPAARDLLEVLELDGAVVTMDALHTQHAAAALVTGAGADHVLTVKADQSRCMRGLRHCPGLRFLL